MSSFFIVHFYENLSGSFAFDFNNWISLSITDRNPASIIKTDGEKN